MRLVDLVDRSSAVESTRLIREGSVVRIHPVQPISEVNMNDELTNTLDDEKEPSLLETFATSIRNWAQSHDRYEWFFIVVFGVPLTCIALMILGAVGLEFVNEFGWFTPFVLTAAMFVVLAIMSGLNDDTPSYYDPDYEPTTAKHIFWGGILFSGGLMVLSAMGIGLIAFVVWLVQSV